MDISLQPGLENGINVFVGLEYLISSLVLQSFVTVTPKYFTSFIHSSLMMMATGGGQWFCRMVGGTEKGC